MPVGSSIRGITVDTEEGWFRVKRHLTPDHYDTQREGSVRKRVASSGRMDSFLVNVATSSSNPIAEGLERHEATATLLQEHPTCCKGKTWAFFSFSLRSKPKRDPQSFCYKRKLPPQS